LPEWVLMFKASGCMVRLYSLCRGRALRSDPEPMIRGWLRRNRESRPSVVGPMDWLAEGFVFVARFLWWGSGVGGFWI
jgi:hypothetical protein